jgi:hypothetical protein
MAFALLDAENTLVIVFSYLDLRRVGMSSAVNRLWNSLLQDGFLWRHFIRRDLLCLSHLRDDLGLENEFDFDLEYLQVFAPKVWHCVGKHAEGGGSHGDWRAAYRDERNDRAKARKEGVRIGSPFWEAMFKACGKLPARPDLSLLLDLTASRDFTQRSDDYQDKDGSTLLMYCVGPANRDTREIVRVLKRFGANPAHRNHKGESALAYAKAWKAFFSVGPGEAGFEDLYVSIIQDLVRDGCDEAEPSAF